MIWLQKQKKMKEQRRKETYSGCSDLRQIQDGTDTFQGRKPHVRGTRSHNPPSTPAKLTKLTRNEECEGVTWEFWGTSTTLCSSPSSLYTETNQWPSSMKKLGRRRTSFCNRWQLIWNRKGELSKFLHLKVLESVKLGLSCFDVLSLQIFPKLAYIARDYIFPEIVLKSF